jgi:hypothetical protein
MRSIFVIIAFLGLAIILFSILGSSIESEAWIQAQYELVGLVGPARQDDVAKVMDAHRSSLLWEAGAYTGLAICVASGIGLAHEKRRRTKT